MIDDERGRVPFAVIAVLLLVSSAAIATTMRPAPPPDEPAVDIVVDRVEAEQRTALRDAVRAAASDAASDPVIEPANSTVGRAIGDDRTFRRSLRLRIYVAARENLRAIDRRRGDVRGTATLPPVDVEDPASVRAAIDRIELTAADPNATAISVRVRNVTTTVRQGGRILNERTTSPRVIVATPVLALHDRVAAYERRLDAPVTEPGLERRLAALLNAAGWTRGYAQYGGMPIDNVISNTHVALATNAAALDVQRSTIGRADPAGVANVGEALAKASAQELLAMEGGSSPFLEQAVADHEVVDPNEIEGLDVPARDEPMAVGVDTTAADVFLLMVDGGELPGAHRWKYGDDVRLGEIFDGTYAANARLSTAVLDRFGGVPDPSPPPGDDWEQIDTDLDASVSVRPAPANATRTVPAAGDWHGLSSFSRRVVTEYERTTTWARGIDRETTHSTGRETVTVAVTVLGEHAPAAAGPDRPISGVHEAGAGPLDGPNLAGVEGAATDRLIDERGGRDAVARRAAAGQANESTITVRGRRPAELRDWVYRDIADLRRAVANVSVDVDRRDLGTFAVNPPQLLGEKLRERRATLIDAPPSYEGVADRARVAARARFLDLTIAALEYRADRRSANRDRLGEKLEDAGTSIEGVTRSVHAAASPPGPRRPALTGPGGPVGIRVDAAPAYLSLSRVEESALPAVDGELFPLSAHNWNVFTVPYGEAVSGFVDAVLDGPERTRLGTAARTLRSAAGVEERLNASQRARRAAVEGRVDGKIDVLRAQARSVLDGRDVGNDEGRRAIVRSALSRWNGTVPTALALSNGSAATAIVEVADGRTTLTAVERDRLALELDRRLRDTLETDVGQPTVGAVEELHETAKSEVAGAMRTVAENYTERAITRLTNGTISSVPNGLPLTPVPGYWYATTNLWHVEVEGEYARFGVRATRGRPSEPGAGLAYARDGENVTFDVDGDGSQERLGRSRRVAFDATVSVVVVVPPGAQGVGDAAGPADEQSPGWK